MKFLSLVAAVVLAAGAQSAMAQANGSIQVSAAPTVVDSVTTTRTTRPPRTPPVRPPRRPPSRI